jgi:cytochrome c553
MLDAIVWTAALMFLVVLGVHEAHAGEHRYANADPTYQAECGSCHVAYPPALLSASGWTAVLDRLDRHYGVDASLDPATARTLRDYILANSGRKSLVEPVASNDLPRISTLPWFLKEHREVTGKAAPRNVKSMSDCAACHTRAAQGDFAESTLRIPR